MAAAWPCEFRGDVGCISVGWHGSGVLRDWTPKQKYKMEGFMEGFEKKGPV